MSAAEHPLTIPSSVDLARRYSPGSSRRVNTGLILGQLDRNGPLSRTQLAERAGMTKALVASVVGELIEWGLIAECEVTHTGQSGRPSRPLEIAGRWIHGMGLEIRSDHVTGMLTELSGRVVAKGEMPLLDPGPELADQDGGELLGVLLDVAGGLLAETKHHGAVTAGVCLSVPGQLLRRRSSAGTGPLRWTIGDLSAELQNLVVERAGPLVEVRVQRSATLAALAEHRLTGRPPEQSLVAVYGGVAIDAGVLVDGRLLRGATGQVGDVGHLVVDPGGARCSCGGRGCWETVVGVEAVLREAAPDLAGDPRSARPPVVINEVVSRAERGDITAREGLEQVGRWLGVGLATIVAMFNPDHVVLDGYFATLAPWILPSAQTVVDDHAGGPASSACVITASGLDGSASTIGGALLAADAVFTDPVPVLLAVSGD